MRGRSSFDERKFYFGAGLPRSRTTAIAGLGMN
jgi:hypothetical protein